MIDIDKGVPLPVKVSPSKTVYPWDAMKINDSFLVSLDDLNRVSAAASKAGKRKGKRFTVRKTKDGIRVWRVE